MEKAPKTIQDVLEIHKIANSLISTMETFRDKGRTPLAYQMKDSYSHLMTAIREENSPQPNREKIESELEECVDHLERVIYDATEMFVLSTLEKLHKGVKYVLPKTITEVYSEYHKDYAKLIEFRDAFNDYKGNKSSKNQLSDFQELEKMFNEAVEINTKFDSKKLLMKQATRRYIIWAALGLIATVVVTGVVTGVVTYFCSR